MSRKTIVLPDDFIYAMEYDVLYTDVNSANHLGADRVLPIAMEAQLRFIKLLGYQNATAFEDAGLIMVHSEIQYVSEAVYGDRLKVELAIASIEDKSIELAYRISHLSSNCEMARILTTLLFYDYREKRAMVVPHTFLQAIDGSKTPLPDQT